MKKSELRKIIKESIRQLMTEQQGYGTLVSLVMDCNSSWWTGIGGQLSGEIMSGGGGYGNGMGYPGDPLPAFTTPPTPTQYKEVAMSCIEGQIIEGDTVTITGQNYDPDTQYPGGSPWTPNLQIGNTYFAAKVWGQCSICDDNNCYGVPALWATDINANPCPNCCTSNGMWEPDPAISIPATGHCWDNCPPPVEKYRCHDCNTPCAQNVIDAGHCPYDTTQECLDQCAETNKWRCGLPDKFGNPRCLPCKQFELLGGTTCYNTQAQCLASNCPGKLAPDMGKTITTPFTTDPQSKITDPEIDRMQRLANIDK